MFISEITTSAEEVQTGTFGYSPMSHTRRKAILGLLWERYPLAERICLIERGGPRQKLQPGPMEVLYIMPKRGLYNRRVEVRVGLILEVVS